METDPNLLFGVLALQAGLIDAAQFVEACTLWSARRPATLADLLLERRWITSEDKAHVDYLLKRRSPHQDGDDAGSTAQMLLAPGLAPTETPREGRRPPPETMAAVPDFAARYALAHVHAVGGIGRVWLVRDSQLGRDVALKELLPESADRAPSRKRFFREAQITGQLEHPGIVPVYEMGRRSDTRQPYYTMRFVKGRTLAEAIDAFHQKRRAGQEEPLALLELLNAFVAVCNTLAYAHSRGVLHRDLKGPNIILGDFGEVIVLDWGLAKLMGRTGGEAAAPLVLLDEDGEDDGAGLTTPGLVVGTPAYMAPEQTLGWSNRLDHRTDVYGLGAVLYEILTGKPPFQAADPYEVIRQVQQAGPVPPRRHWPGVPPALEAACLRAMAREPAERHASAADLGREVHRWQEVQRRRAEDALRRQTEILQSILDSMSEAVVVADLSGNLLLSNPAARRLAGILPTDATLAEARARYEVFLADQKTLFPPEDVPLARAVRGEAVDDVEMFLRPRGKPDGLWASANARPLRDETGALRGGVAVFHDITGRKQAEAALRQSHNLLRAVTEGTTDAVYVKDREGRYLMVNSAAARFMGRPAEEIVGKDDREFFDAESAARVRERDRLVMEAGASETVEEDLVSAGVRRTYLAAKGPYRDGQGAVIGLIGVSRDISDRKIMEDELRRGRERFELAVRGSQDGLWDWDLETNEVYFSPRWKAILGYEDGETPNRLEEWEKRLHPDERAAVLAANQDHIADKTPYYEYEYRMRHKDGSYRWILARGVALRDAAGKAYRMAGSHVDLTARKRAEAALRESEERYHAVLAALPVGVLIVDADGEVRGCNASAERLLGLTADQLREEALLDSFWRATREDGSALTKEAMPTLIALRTGEPSDDVVVGVHKPDGGLTRVSVTSRPLFRPDETSPYAVVSSFVEIAEGKRPEEAAASTARE